MVTLKEVYDSVKERHYDEAQDKLEQYVKERKDKQQSKDENNGLGIEYIAATIPTTILFIKSGELFPNEAKAYVEGDAKLQHKIEKRIYASVMEGNLTEAGKYTDALIAHTSRVVGDYENREFLEKQQEKANCIQEILNEVKSGKLKPKDMEATVEEEFKKIRETIEKENK